jgi:PAS domain S-box-containing protein
MALNGQVSRQIVQELYEIAPCGFLSTLQDGTIVKANRTFLDWSGYSLEEALSKKFQELLSIPARIFYETQFAPLLQLQGMVKEVAFEIVRNDREPLPVLVNSVQRQQEGGGAVLIHSALFDATDRRKYEQQLLSARRELESEVLERTKDLEREIAERKRVEEDLRELTGRLLQLKDEETMVRTWCTVNGFVRLLSDHVPDHYRHAIRYFGLLAPTAKRKLERGLFLLLEQQRLPRPRRLTWRE